MKKLLYTLVFASFCLLASAQTNVRYEFQWAPQADNYILGDGTTLQQWSFEGAVFDDSAPSHPQWIHRFPLSSMAKLEVEVVDISYEPFDKVPFFDDEQLSETITFHANAVDGIDGTYAKITCVPYIKSGNQYQRIRYMNLNIKQTTSPSFVGRGGPPSNSVLSNGDIYKIAISQTGIHKLSYDFLKNELGISNLDEIDPRQLKLYGNGGRLLPYSPSADYIDDLAENAIRIVGEEDGSFDSGDYILFYAEGPNKWTYNTDNDRYKEIVNVYDTRNYYFIKTGDSATGKRLSTRNSISGTAMNVNSYDGVFRYEQDNMNVLHEIETTGTGTGQHWYSDFFKFAREKDYNNVFELPGLITTEEVRIWAEMALRANISSRFYLDIEGQTLTSNAASSINIGGTNEINNNLAPTAFIYDNISLSNPSVNIKLRYPNAGSVQSSGWLDFIQARARLALAFAGNEIRFQDSRTLGANSATYTLSNAASDVEIWDITDPTTVLVQQTNSSGSSQSFGVETNDQLRWFTAFRKNADFIAAEAIGKIDNQNLHNISGAEMLIVYHTDFADAAMRLVDHRANHSDLNVSMVPIDKVYNEYSSGRVSPTAIRNFAKSLYQEDGSLRYLLLIGDGSFDCRDIYGLGANFIPVYERDANHEIEGFPADDYFVIFQSATNTNDPLANDLNISIGRLPVKTAEEANAVVSKIIDYETNPEYLGDWRTRMTFLADDEDSGSHSDDADDAAEVVMEMQEQFNDNKLFFDLFPQESTPAGDRFPSVQEQLNNAIFKGSLITTYLGHGGPKGWAQERVLDIPIIRNWENLDKLSLFITATCSFGDFDNSDFVSAAEELLLSPKGGAVGLLTTTRPVYAHRNSALTNRSLTHLLTQNADGSWPKLGDVIRLAKNDLSSSSSYTNERKFMLMGDPAMEVALPTYKVETTSINGMAIDTSQMDTISSLEKVTFTGRIVDLNGNLMENFNGSVFPTIYDKRQAANTLRNDPEGSPLKTYMVQKNVLFKGKASVTNGLFSFSFIVPKDINYAYGRGKLSYYAADLNQEIDASGSEDRFIIGGSNPDGVEDDQAPLVEVFMNSEDFISGGTVDANPTLVVKLADDFGINVSGNSIGHDLEGFLNEDTQNSYLLNDFYEAADNDYTKGEARFPLRDLSPGKYTMRVRAWDVGNNMGEGSTEFIVAGDGKIALEHVLNYPNPFTDHTCFQFDSSVAGTDMDVLIQVYTVSGRLVKTINTVIQSADGALRQDDCISWDGRDDYGDQLARGVYLYKVKVRTQGGTELNGESEFEKLVILK